MIFQASVELEIEGRDVHVIFDMDTGMIGFTEVSAGKRNEYSYQSGPQEFKIAFVKLMEGLAGKSHQSNGLICRKAEAAKILQEFWERKYDPKS